MIYRVLHVFGGAGGCGIGFARARRVLFDTELRFETIGSIDTDPEACADFTYFTGAPTLCADVATLTPERLRAFAGERAPDVVVGSPPCKGASALLSEEKSRTPKYEALNRLVHEWTRLMLETWPDAPPRLVIYENVPRITKRAKAHVAEARRLVRAAGYVVNERYHDCGEIGGLAQHRRRWLMVARHAKRVPSLLYTPPKKRVRGCGEVLGELPVPTTPGSEAWSRLHALPKISLLNWCRLALIPAGGDWRDLNDVLQYGEPRRAKFRRHRVEKWDEPTPVVTGSGSNAVGAVADPRPRFDHVDRVRAWDEASGTVTSAPAPSSGAPSVADPRVSWFHGVLGVMPWDDPARAVIGGRANGAINVADPRPFRDSYGVVPWDEATGTITGRASPSTGRFSVADLRVKKAFDAGYKVLHWTQAAQVIAGTTAVGCGAFSVADPRAAKHWNKLRVEAWDEAAHTVTGATRPNSGAPSIADPRKPPKEIPIIIAQDGTWHRPLTTLELAALQGFPMHVNGEPVRFAGPASHRWRERIGNAIPPPTAEEIAGSMLLTLAHADAGSFVLSGDGEVWVEPAELGA